ncbi:hypothetical protein ACA910_017311 [Epithemia clementina (nom. ined.)]
MSDSDSDSMVYAISYHEMYHALLFLIALYLGGKLAQKGRMPAFVGEVVVGMLLGPPLAKFVPSPEAFVLLGEIGLILMIVQSGMNVDVSLLRMVGTRGILVAWIGCMISIGLGILLATIVMDGGGDDEDGDSSSNDKADATDNKAHGHSKRAAAAIAAGLALGPTSLTLVRHNLRLTNFDNTPMGQLLLAAAVMQEIMALVLLSELQALSHGHLHFWTVVLSMITSRLFLLLGLCLALLYIPPLLHSMVYPYLLSKPAQVGTVEMAILLAMALVLMEAAQLTQTSYWMACFLAGLSFCTSPTLQVEWMRQWHRVITWLMRLFFAATIGFPVLPLSQFMSKQVLFQGLILSFAWTGKVAAGFLTIPNSLSQTSRSLPAFTGLHLRDCLVTGWALASQGEMALLIAVTAHGQGLHGRDLYAALVVAILVAAVVPPFVLRRILRYYNWTTHKELVQVLAQAELERRHDLDRPLVFPSKSFLRGRRSHGVGGGAGSRSHAPQMGGMANEEDIAVLIDLLSISERDNRVMSSNARGDSGYRPSGHRSSSGGGGGSLRNQTIVFLCIQTQCEGQWGLLQLQMMALARQGLDVIDHRLWHCSPRQRFRHGPQLEHYYSSGSSSTSILATSAVDATTWMNEIYVKAILTKSPHDGLTSLEALEQRIHELKEALIKALSQPPDEGGIPARVHIQRWYPGVVEETIEAAPPDNSSRTMTTTATSTASQPPPATTMSSPPPPADTYTIGDDDDGGGDFVGLRPDQQEQQQMMMMNNQWYLTLDEAVHRQVVSNGVFTERQVQEILQGLPEFRPVRASPLPPPLSSRGRPPPPSRPVRRRSPVIGGGLFRDAPAAGGIIAGPALSPPSPSAYPRGNNAIEMARKQRMEHLQGQRMDIVVDDETYHARMGAKDIRKLKRVYNTNPKILPAFRGHAANDEDDDDDDDDEDDEDNYYISYGGGGLVQEVVDLFIQPNMGHVTDMLRGYVRHGAPLVMPVAPSYDHNNTSMRQQQEPPQAYYSDLPQPMDYPQYSDQPDPQYYEQQPLPPQPFPDQGQPWQQQQHQQYQQPEEEIIFSDVAINDRNTNAPYTTGSSDATNTNRLHWGGRGRNYRRSHSPDPPAHSWSGNVLNRAKQFRRGVVGGVMNAATGAAAARGGGGGGGGHMSSYAPVQPQPPPPPPPPQAAAAAGPPPPPPPPPPAHADSGGDDIIEQALDLLQVPPNTMAGGAVGNRNTAAPPKQFGTGDASSSSTSTSRNKGYHFAPAGSSSQQQNPQEEEQIQLVDISTDRDVT